MLQLNVYRSALISRNLSCPEKFLVTRLCSFMLCNKSDHKKYRFVLVLYVFLDISSFNSGKGDTAKLSRTGFIYKQKKISTGIAKLQEIHS